MKCCFSFGIILLFFLGSCEEGVLRGREVRSKDGKTYLVVLDNNEGACDELIIDGVLWSIELNEPGRVSPGIHTIECSGKIEFEIKNGFTFYFDYWGP